MNGAGVYCTREAAWVPGPVAKHAPGGQTALPGGRVGGRAGGPGALFRATCGPPQASRFQRSAPGIFSLPSCACKAPPAIAPSNHDEGLCVR